MKKLKVIGIGLNKTGTTTLAKGLHVLGYQKHVSVRGDLLAKYKNGDLEEIFEVVEENESFEDWPWPLMYKELFFRFGGRARYILTKRKDSLTWLSSLKQHALRTPPALHSRLLAYGYNYPHGAEEYHLKFYENHNQNVRDFFREHNSEHLLLEVSWDAGHGWKELCAFLGEPVPSIDFPHENEGSTPPPPQIVQENKRLIELQKKLLLSKPFEP